MLSAHVIHGRSGTPLTPLPPDPFEQRWLAEATRLREAAHGLPDDAAANRAARAHGGDMELRLRQRALNLAEAQGGLLDALHGWNTHARVAAMVLAALALLGGASMGAAALGDGQRPVNVVWALGALLGLHLLTLLLWLMASLAGSGDGGSLAGRVWIALGTRIGRSRGEAWLPQAIFDMARGGGVLSAWLGRLSHGLWTLTLAGALLSMLALLSTRRYGFMWETTLLSEEVFVALTAAVGALPAALGIAMPDPDMVRRAGSPTAAALDAQLWSAWLLGALVLYGLLPRVLLWMACQWRWRRFRARFQLDLSRPEYARLARQLMPAAETTGVSDSAPAELPRFHAGHGGAIDNGPHLALALELGPDQPWPPAGWPAHLAGARLDSREARRANLDALAARPVERLLVAVDARLSPDRGALALIAELSAYAHRLAVWLDHTETAGERADHWRDALAGAGLAPADILTASEVARRWLESEHD
jgi:hypothetical protein